MTLKQINQARVFGGCYQQFTHTSDVLGCDMRFSVFIPSKASTGSPLPAMYWLSGLTCTDENFMHKAGVFRLAEELGLIIIAPDTSPRGEDVADDPEGSYDLGLGAGFYLNATQPPWSSHYRMYDYIATELPKLVERHFPASSVKSIFGHSMGGHGALTIALKNQEAYRSVSAFSPISNPINCPWGQKAFLAYLGTDQNTWKQYDSCELLKEHGCALPILVDQGDEDNFLLEQLKPENLVESAKSVGANLELRMQKGYDHSYFFIQSFIEDHLRFHFAHLSRAD
ncbi:S-formylglutathione hydrolase [Oleiphilus sp. HI0068]|uniref:S-formylglutathione hydrolase n=2 Tax=Oleiphilus TaxID=141450 RepID=UPI0007C3D92C|nr:MULTISPECIES: S-formylglutathione hydrolase [unclassified Oleiphilus]KZY72720.1 S-formylglutathione hydrolase [Oleiphilus sp. HI0068]KZY75400.1 S-formylglutathione hydrolase [Oleiphilus sp. HI0069]KZY96122.1 S-formylglutathione hydrolase [Oleiphilus sp. HI0072]KZZ31362.1 S-formylglutathione hydrolase [Oleiphilus sp. HI0085]KZY32693.1 S-formylglutathione hydrolase [Oleiphilus sp. HI0043]